ncbi:MAG: MoxR family ATPase [Spirirestis rafaelensis WJT71-NPBG6]|jgi:MoxR-like ATPase|nr:MoxR family ATPase [Spirirestis rafaelensis WJT71-NPBG6]
MVEILNRQFEYTGKIQPHLGERLPNGKLLSPYLPSPELVEAVNLAIYLERPLLLKGEPGCGKTLLASAVAHELNLPLEAWYVKSTSRARDGLYTYDAVGRLRDAQLAASDRLKPEQLQRLDDAASYVRWGPLGRAFGREQRSVVLIDEIDKADIDFPNDLLLELDEKRFIVEETGQEIEAKAAPIVFISSNDEKDLPDAFLRRCLFHYVEFPTPERLIKIMNVLFPTASEVLVNQAVTRFLQLREEMRKEGVTGKNVSTSELIDWFRVLRRYPEDEVLAKLKGKLPFLGVLLKSWDDHVRYLRQAKSSG